MMEDNHNTIHEESNLSSTDANSTLADESLPYCASNDATAESATVQTHVEEEHDASVIDNPCWGSPTTCSLTDLLKLIIKKRDVILYESSDYIVLRKPPDLRMEGDYPATAHKLLSFWYPSPSLLYRASVINKKRAVSDVVDTEDKSILSNSSVDSNPNAAAGEFVPTPYTPHQMRLLKVLSTIPRHCDVTDNELRPCHQLDYATSGVLLIARSKATASRARNAFENRRVQKSYTAVVQGHIHIPKKESYYNYQTIEMCDGDAYHQDHNWSYVTHRALQATMLQMEYDYRKARQRHHKVTFQGFLPAHNIFHRWQDRQRMKLNRPNQRQEYVGDKKRAWNKKKSMEWDSVFKEVDALSDFVKNPIISIKWDDLKNSENDLDRSVVAKFKKAADNYNNIARGKIGEMKQKARIVTEALPALPTFFRVKENPETDDDSFYIFAPLAQDDVNNNFAMLIHPSNGHLCSHLRVGDPKIHEFKPSLTSCTVLHRTYIHSSMNNSNNEMEKIPVSIVKMEPKTGRRHQLRIHTALLGHPIAGDATYCDDETKQEGRSIVERMCLHSSSLKIPKLLPNEMDFEIESESPFRFQVIDDTSFVTVDTI
jgi:23S rRNA-/tRNA-specific pseudouridylate synthase